MPTRARAQKWKPEFLAALKTHANVSEAANAAGVSRAGAYARREKSPKFAALWDAAIEEAIDAIELAVTTASLDGDMQTARWFLSRRRPEVYGDKVALEHSGSVQSEPVTLKVVWHDTDSDDAD